MGSYTEEIKAKPSKFTHIGERGFSELISFVKMCAHGLN